MAIEDNNTATQNNGNSNNGTNSNGSTNESAYQFKLGENPFADKQNKGSGAFQATSLKNPFINQYSNPLDANKLYADYKKNTPTETQTEEDNDAQTAAPNGRDLAISYFQQKMNESAPPSVEDLKKERRRRRTEMAMAGMSDMARAISNLVFATKGAPNMYDPSADMSPKYKEKWDKIKAEREQRAKEREGYELKYIEQILAKDADELKQEQTDFENRLKDIRAQNEAKKTQLYTMRLAKEIDDKEYARQLKQADFELKKEESKARQEYYKARTRRLQNTPIRGAGSGGGRKATKNSDGTITLVEEVATGSFLNPGKQRVTMKFRNEEELQKYLKKKEAEANGNDYKIPGA